jgi:hypothetical protein
MNCPKCGKEITEQGIQISFTDNGSLDVQAFCPDENCDGNKFHFINNDDWTIGD